MRFVISLVISLGAACHVSAEDVPRVKEGWDWTLPADVKPTRYSGYITWGNSRFHPSITVRGIMVTWKRLNPAPGEYDWQWVRDEIAKNESLGMRTGIHLKGVQRDSVPDWIVEELKPVVLDVPPLQESQPWRIQTVPPWQPKVDEAFHEFLRAFAKTGIAQDKNVVYGYIHGISASRGEEMFIRPVDLAMWQETTGLTAPQFAGWLRRRIDGICDAFRGNEHKLAITWHGALGPTEELLAATADLHEYAFRRGTGIRGGGIDFMHSLIDAPAWGAYLDRQGYMIVDDEHPTIRENRFRGDENEEYGRYWEWRFGPVDGFPYRHRICVLRGLQMRQNFQFVSPATLELNPELSQYAMITQGYRRHDSPDAWAYLRQFAQGSRPVKNIERWLIQRDAAGSQSVPAERVDRAPLPSERRRSIDAVHDFDARRTDVRHGQTGLLFSLDKVFWSRSGPATIKVTYTDCEPARWHIAYTDGNGAFQRTEPVSNTGDGKRKTATFCLASLAAGGKFPCDPGFHQWLAQAPEHPQNLVRGPDISEDLEAWHLNPAYRILPDADRSGRSLLRYRFEPADDTVHVDQLVPLKKDTLYRLTASIKNEGVLLKPAVRVARMDWSTVVYLESTVCGQWETLSDTFRVEADGNVRLQLFGQGRGNQAAGQAGESCFRDIAIRPVARDELRDSLSMDFRIETEGPGDVTVTMVRVVKGIFGTGE